MVFFSRSFTALVTKLGRGHIPSPAYDKLPFNKILPLLIGGIYQQAYSEGRVLNIIQIGANDGVKDDPLLDIIGKPGTRSLLVEPQPACIQKLKDKYKDNPNVIIVGKAVGAESGVITLFKFENDIDRSKQVSVFCSADRRHLEKWKLRLGIASQIISFQVEVLPLLELINAYAFTDIDILITDVEGFDYDILHPYLRDCSAFPRWLVYEKCNLSPKKQESLVSLSNKAGGGVHDFGMDALVVFKDS